MEPIDHPVSRYALDVVEGRETAGELVRLACLRHLTDLETGRDRGLWFDCKAASRVLNFAELIQHTTGPLAGRPLTLRPWQAFRHGSVFGWKKEGGLRRFRTTYHQVAKKNGKTTDTAVPALFTALFDREAAPQGYCAATTRDQAGLLFRELKRMIRASPHLSALMQVWRTSIEVPATEGLIACLSRDGNSSDGINPHFAARDEVHRWTDRELAEVLTNSMIARAQPIDWAITTAGADRASLCGEMRDYAEEVVRGTVSDDSFFAYVAEPPQDCDVADPRFWKMANPNLGVAFSEERFGEMYREATVISGKMPNFRRLHMNLWTEGAQTWIARDVWDRGAEPFDPRALYGLPAWVGLDLSKTTDLTAISVAVPKDGQIYLLAYSFLPEGPKGFIARAQKEKREYVAWRDAGWLEVHSGGVIDEDQVIERLETIRARFDLRELAYDRWGMKYMAKELLKRRFPLVEHGQGYGSMSSPMKRFEEAVAKGRIRHAGNPVLAWSSYLFEPITELSEFVLTDLPPYAHAVLKIEALRPGGTVGIGQLVCGPLWPVGRTAIKGSGFQGVDFSYVAQDEFGDLTTVRRAATRLSSFEVWVENARLLGLDARLRTLRGGTAAVWIGDDDPRKAAMNYGFYRGYRSAYQTDAWSLLQIDVQGIV